MTHPERDEQNEVGERCCHGRCGRGKQQAPMLMRSDLTGVWYVVMRYKHRGGRSYEALLKHELCEDSQRQLEEMRGRAS